jgi:hypothetical protein
MHTIYDKGGKGQKFVKISHGEEKIETLKINCHLFAFHRKYVAKNEFWKKFSQNTWNEQADLHQFHAKT